MSTDIKTISGQPVILSCSATGRPKPHLYWLRGEQNLSAQTEHGRNYLITNDGKILTLLEPTPLDAGEYICLAKSVAGERSTRFNVTVLGNLEQHSYEKCTLFICLIQSTEPPTIRRQSMSAMLRSGGNDSPDPDDISEEIQVQQGETFQLHCPVSGNPIPAVNWLKLHYDDIDGYREERVNNPSTDTTTLVRRELVDAYK